MVFELNDISYESYLQHAQIEITGYCNMHCKHCRAADETNKHLTLGDVEKILNFIDANKEEDFRLTISGGEPFIHPNIVDIISMVKQRNIEDVIITSNASLINVSVLNKLDEINMHNLCIQLSLDSIYPETHDQFRGYKGAYKSVINAVNLIKPLKNVKVSLRMTVTKDTLNEVASMVDLAYNLGVERIGIGAVIPVGAGEGGTLTLNCDEKRHFLNIMAEKKIEYLNRLDVTTEDPLKFAIENTPWEYCDNNEEIGDDFFGGCTAGLTGFNVNSDGIITPCAVLFEKVLDINDFDSISKMTKAYENSNVIKTLITRKYIGKCGKCKLNRICGGCRATAKGLTGNFMESDMTCWK